ncbi:MAG TPA: glutamate-1-semialdehyde 2,1-aminomutase [Candidatus Dormibacteraeota bacterium]|nr:glutamate-1-semialdehyde 2,1-aminomutase [Candidatus Dormibacteraeota bacterium]
MTAEPGPAAAAALAAACRVIPGGVNSPVRAFGAVGGVPPFFVRGHGAELVDTEGHTLIDCVLAYGPLILGHGHPAVVRALRDQVGRGTAFGGPTEAETRLAERIVGAVPSVEMVRLVNSGTEATMSAVRLARAATGRDKIVKFDGGYHGHSDGLLAAAGSGVATLGLPGSPGVPAATVGDTIVLPFNDLEAVRAAFERQGESVAAILVEPVAGNMGVVPPRAGYLAGLRELTQRWGALLIFDEVMTGFRVAWGGAQALFDVRPDLTCLGKVIGGGLPVGAYGGTRVLMEQIAPAGPVYQAGTLSGNPLAVAAGLATLDALADGRAYTALEAAGARLEAGLRAAAATAGIAVTVNRVGSMLTPFFHPGPVEDYAQARQADRDRFAQVHRGWLASGVFWPPSQFEAGFLSTAHDPATVDRVVAAFGTAVGAAGGRP